MVTRRRKPSTRHEQITVELFQRIEGLERVLENWLNLVHKHHAVGAATHHGKIDAVEQQRAAGGLFDIQNHPRQRSLAAAGFADDGENLMLLRLEPKADVADGVNPPARDHPTAGEGLANMLHVEKCAHGASLPLTAKQATRCPGAVSSMVGTPRLQSSIASGVCTKNLSSGVVVMKSA